MGKSRPGVPDEVPQADLLKDAAAVLGQAQTVDPASRPYTAGWLLGQAGVLVAMDIARSLRLIAARMERE